MVDKEKTGTHENEAERDKEKTGPKGEPELSPAGSVAKPNEVPGTEPSDSRAAEQGERKRQRALEWSTTVQAWCSIMIAIFALGQVVFGHLQWDATNKQYVVMEKQLDLMRAEQRAWLSITPPINAVMEAGKRFDWHCRIRNSGQTPGTIIGEILIRNDFLATDAGIAVSGEKISVTDFDFDSLAGRLGTAEKKGPQKTVIPPGEVEHFMAAEERELPESEADGIAFGSLIPVCFYRLVYVDVYGSKHTSTTCFSYNSKSKRWDKQGKYDYMD